jgi:hypothetical protein
MSKTLKGYALAGKSESRERVENDFYATNPKALDMLFDAEPFGAGTYLEPSAGQGHLSNRILELIPNAKITNLDVVDRGLDGVIVADFLEYSGTEKYDYVITNPPYSLGKEFVDKGLELLKDGGKMAMFLKIQFLEGEKRRDMYKNNPPKYIYVFTKRMATFNNGSEVDENGKRWATTMCHAWFVWEKGFVGESVVRWL